MHFFSYPRIWRQNLKNRCYSSGLDIGVNNLEATLNEEYKKKSANKKKVEKGKNGKDDLLG